ncbi:MAG: LTA synthase family protein [Firmicutes bacterium]|nr:LTA synthase family protein [Bacillota bacterium]
MKNTLNNFKEYARLCLNSLRGVKGIVYCVMFLFIIAKFGSFYSFMDITANYAVITIISSMITAVIFTAFRRKIIPAVIYTFVSILMFADVIYHGYYNAYLSVDLLNSAGMLGDITESIMEILQPEYFLIFADAAIILIVIAVNFTVKKILSGKTKETEGFFLKVCRRLDVRGEHVKEFNDFAASEKSDCGKTLRVSVSVFLMLVLIFNPLSGNILTSAGSQELFSYHTRDLLGADANDDTDKYYIANGTYERNLSGDLYGAAEGRNLIVIQVESLQNFVINREYNGQEITPFLNSLISDGDTVYFDHYYYQTGGGNTSDAEFATNNSILGTLKSYTYDLYEDNYFKGLPWLLRDKGYSTAVMHGYDKKFWNRKNMYPKQGFQKYFDDSYYTPDDDYTGEGFVSVCDESFYDMSIPALKSLKQPFYAFMITLSGHHPFDQESDNQLLKPAEGDEGTIVYNYINTARYEDESLEMFFKKLKDSGLYDNSIICIYGDHYGLSCEKKEISEQLSDILDEKYNLKWHFNIPLIINIPGEDVNKTISTAGGQLDFMPTIAYLMGFKTLDTLYIGKNLITAEEGYAAIQSFMLKGSFITDDVLFQQSRDGIFSNSKAYDINTWEKLDVEDYEEFSLKSKQISNMSQFYLDNDVLDKVLNKGLSINDILAGVEKKSTPDTVIHVSGDKYTGIIEAMDNAYEKGERCLFVKAAPEAVYKELKKEKSAKLHSALSCGELVSWSLEHEDAYVIIDIETGNDPYISKSRSDLKKDTEVQGMTELFEALSAEAEKEVIYTSESYRLNVDTEHIIINASTMKYFTAAQDLGFENIMFQPELNAYTESDYKTFFMSYTPWAILVDEGTEESDLTDLYAAESCIYERSGDRDIKIFEPEPDIKEEKFSLIKRIGDGNSPAAAIIFIIFVSAGAGGLTLLIRRFKRRKFNEDGR